jgi:hypothetical protein
MEKMGGLSLIRFTALKNRSILFIYNLIYCNPLNCNKGIYRYIKLMTALALLSLIGLGLASTDYAYGWARKDFDKNNEQHMANGYHLIEVNTYVPPWANDGY